MARHVLNLTTASPIAPLPITANKSKYADAYLATVFFVGTFGGATAALELSPDNGANWFTAQNQSGTAVTSTAAANFNITLGVGNKINDNILIRGNLTTVGSGAAISIILFDNRS